MSAVNLPAIGMGPAILLIGLLTLYLYAALSTGNTPALVMWGFTAIILVFTTVFSVPPGLFWIALFGGFVLLVIGFIIQWVDT